VSLRLAYSAFCGVHYKLFVLTQLYAVVFRYYLSGNCQINVILLTDTHYLRQLQT